MSLNIDRIPAFTTRNDNDNDSRNKRERKNPIQT